MTTVAQWLREARAHGVDRLDAQLLLARALGCSRTALIAHDEVVVPSAAEAQLQEQLALRRSGVPLAYLLGEREFHGLLLQVGPGVLVPRPDTETLVDWALQRLQQEWSQESEPRVLDLGTGSGAVALAIKAGCARARVTGVDLSAQALHWAVRNGQTLGLEVSWRQGDWFDALASDPPARFHLIVANPPYIDAADPHLLALHAEPAQALSPGSDGLSAIAAIARQAAAHLVEGGGLLVEHGHLQGAAVRELLHSAGFVQVHTRRDLAGHERCAGATAAGPTAQSPQALSYPDGTFVHSPVA